MVEVWTFVAISIPIMIALGIRHALDIDHITAIDNLVRLYSARKKSRWSGAGFSIGHMVSVLAEMILIIYVVGSVTSTSQLAFWGGVIGAVALGTIGAINIYAMKKWGRSGAAILASKVLARTGIVGPFSSAVATGIVFGLGFDTATQISALALSAVASATVSVQAALILAGFFALGMIPVDTLDSVVLRSIFSRILDTRGFRYMSYALSGSAVTVATLASYGMLTNAEILQEWSGPFLAGAIIAVSLGYGFAKKRRSETLPA